MKEFRYELRKGSRKDICPNCGKREFKPYIDKKTGNPVGERYGRCERINNCGYNNYPKPDKKDNYEPPERSYEQKKPIEYVFETLVNDTLSHYADNQFALYLVRLFGENIAVKLLEKYNVGTAKGGGTIFWQKDLKGKFRTGKVIYYNENGKRSKTRSSWFVHSKIRQDFNFQQCFFGLHLLKQFPEMPAALCESEKTAVLMSVYMPQFIWIASGGSEMLNVQRLNELHRLDKVFPDGGQFEKWEGKTRHFSGRQMDVTVDKAIKEGLIPDGSDILDLIQLKL
jgi:hypothetical protein